MHIEWGPGLHAAVGQRVDHVAYERYIGRWSHLFVPAVLEAADVGAGHRVLDVAIGTGEAALMALSRVGPSGLVVGADISPAMLDSANAQLTMSVTILIGAGASPPHPPARSCSRVLRRPDEAPFGAAVRVLGRRAEVRPRRREARRQVCGLDLEEGLRLAQAAEAM